MLFYYNNKIIRDNKRKSKEESWKEMSNLDCAGHQSAVTIV